MDIPVLGIDVSKSKLDVCLLAGNGKIIRTISNDLAGFQKLVELLESNGVTCVHACMESTGTYGEKVALYLYQRGHIVSVVPPARIKAHGRAEGIRTKTDRVDGVVIATFCLIHKPTAWTPPVRHRKQLQELQRQLQAVKNMRQQQSNRLESELTCESVVSSITQIIACLDRQRRELETEIESVIATDAELSRQSRLITSIPGLANTSAAIVLAEIGDVRRFRHVRQLDAYAGLDVTEKISGSTVRGRPHISKQGNNSLRSALYFPAMAAMRFNPIVRKLAERLRAKGKSPKAIICAAMRKLLHLIFGVLKTNRPFEPDWRLNAT